MLTRSTLSVVRRPSSVANEESRRCDQLRTTDDGPRTGFTLVELLVVITIIGILVALITAAAMGAMRTARQAALKFEVDQIAAGFEKYKDNAGSYPPNLITVTGIGLDPAQPLDDLKRHMRQAFPKHQESENLLRLLVGFAPTASPDASAYSMAGSVPMANGMSAAEATVFWLSGFSADPQYPISGEGGPSYPGNNVQNDPVESRKWVHEFDISKLGPRNAAGYFDDTTMRFIVYPDPRNSGQTRRLNFWVYRPARSTQPIVYFDVSRHPAAVITMSGITGPYDPPAAVDLHVHALKMRSQSSAAGTSPIQFANQGKYQLLHAGVDDDWGADILEKSSVHEVASTDPNEYLLFPTGPFTDEAADTVANFATPARLEDAQP